MAKRKTGTIKAVKKVKVPKFKTYKPKKVSIRVKNIMGTKVHKAVKVGGRTFHNAGTTTASSVRKATKNTGSSAQYTPRPSGSNKGWN